MSPVEGELRLYLDHIRLTLKEASAEALRVAALGIEGEAKIKITENEQVDTGFMRSSTYAFWGDGSNYGTASAEARGKNPDAELNLELSLQDGPADAFAGVCCGANYAIYQEALKSFLYAGAEQVAAEMGAEIERVYKEIVNNGG
jgi:hypothetical protein